MRAAIPTGQTGQGTSPVTHLSECRPAHQPAYVAQWGCTPSDQESSEMGFKNIGEKIRLCGI